MRANMMSPLKCKHSMLELHHLLEIVFNLASLILIDKLYIFFMYIINICEIYTLIRMAN